MLHKFKLGYNATEAIFCAKDEGIIDQSTVTRWFKKFCLGCKNINDQVRSDRPKTVDSKAESIR